MKRKKRTSKKLKNFMIYLSRNDIFFKSLWIFLIIICVLDIFSIFIFKNDSIFVYSIYIFIELLLIFYMIRETDENILRKNKLVNIILSRETLIAYNYILIIWIIDIYINNIVFYFFKLGTGAVNFCIRSFVFLLVLILFVSLEKKIVKKINDKYSKKLK